MPFWSRRRGADRGSRDDGQDWLWRHGKTLELLDFNVVFPQCIVFCF